MGDNKGHVDRSGMCSLSQAQCTTKEAPKDVGEIKARVNDDASFRRELGGLSG
jgi:hypothetical protein